MLRADETDAASSRHPPDRAARSRGELIGHRGGRRPQQADQEARGRLQDRALSALGERGRLLPAPEEARQGDPQAQQAHQGAGRIGAARRPQAGHRLHPAARHELQPGPNGVAESEGPVHPRLQDRERQGVRKTRPANEPGAGRPGPAGEDREQLLQVGGSRRHPATRHALPAQVLSAGRRDDRVARAKRRRPGRLCAFLRAPRGAAWVAHQRHPLRPGRLRDDAP